MKANLIERVSKHRAGLRAAGLRPVQMWVYDTRRKGFADECKRQALLVAESDSQDRELAALLDTSALDIEGWEA
jgi:hypothetical protein